MTCNDTICTDLMQFHQTFLEILLGINLQTEVLVRLVHALCVDMNNSTVGV